MVSFYINGFATGESPFMCSNITHLYHNTMVHMIFQYYYQSIQYKRNRIILDGSLKNNEK